MKLRWIAFWSMITGQKNRCPYWPCCASRCDKRHSAGQQLDLSDVTSAP
jgi:hypothetical protein